MKSLFSFLFTRPAPKAAPFISNVPGTIAFASALTGTAIPLSEVNDPVFSEHVLGDGLAVRPTQGKVYAPIDGIVSSIMDTSHALCFTGAHDIEVLIHVGLDTVKLNGQHFTVHVKVGEAIKQGDLLLSFNIKALRAKNFDVTTPMVICNSDAFSLEPLATGEIAQGAPFMLAHKKGL